MMAVFDIINIQYETADEDFPESMTSILITQDEHWGKTHKVKEMIKLKIESHISQTFGKDSNVIGFLEINGRMEE
jgi:uncharacterized protein (DUF4415 family)